MCPVRPRRRLLPAGIRQYPSVRIDRRASKRRIEVSLQTRRVFQRIPSSGPTGPVPRPPRRSSPPPPDAPGWRPNLDIRILRARRTGAPSPLTPSTFGTRIDEYLDQVGRDAPKVWMNARHQRQHWRISRFARPAQGVHLGAGTKQKPRDLRRVGGRPLPKVLNAVRGEVIHQGRPVNSRRTGADQGRITAQGASGASRRSPSTTASAATSNFGPIHQSRASLVR